MEGIGRGRAGYFLLSNRNAVSQRINAGHRFGEGPRCLACLPAPHLHSLAVAAGGVDHEIRTLSSVSS